ncbi:ComEC/Rec2 family competence protein, partial [Streptomyces xanthophaeus]
MTGAEGPGPVDLRLVGPALAAWAAAALALGAPGSRTGAAVALGAAGAGLLVAAGCRWPGPGQRRRGPLRFALRPARATSATRPGQRAGAAVAAVLLCAAAGAGVAGFERAQARAGPVAGLAREHARVLVEFTVGSDPRVTPQGAGPPVVALDAVVDRVTGPDGEEVRVATPVRVLAGHPGWARLQPSTRVTAVARLAPARGGERAVALLRPAGDGPPRVTG